MKRIYFITLLLSITLVATSQITIISSDMPSANDSIRMSTALNASLYDFTITDTNYTWDFSQLIASSQRSERFMSVSSTPLIYNIVFFSKSNLASQRDDMNVLNINITNGYNFYKNSTSDFRQVGYGASVNGSPIPVTFKSDDVIYRFPIAYGNVDTSDSEWEVNVPNLAFINETIHRVNTVDGWGTITTPYGSYQCIRLKSVVQQEDTIYYTSSGMGLKLPQNFTEYIWLSKDLPFPILKATVTQFGSATVEYADTARQFVGIDKTPSTNSYLKLYPNPSREGFTINISNSMNEHSNLTILDAQGKVLYNEEFRGKYSKQFSKDFLKPGFYLIQWSNGSSIQTKKLIIQ